MTFEKERQEIVRVALSWERTPYHHHAMLKGIGVDCAMILIAVFNEAGVVSAEKVGYSPQWYLHHGEEKYLNELTKYAHEITEAEALPGDVVVYKTGRAYSHGAIIIYPGWPDMIHASPSAGRVVRDRGDGGSLANKPRKFFSCLG